MVIRFYIELHPSVCLEFVVLYKVYKRFVQNNYVAIAEH